LERDAKRPRRRRRRRIPLPRHAHRAHRHAAVIVFAAVAPHGDLSLDPALRSAMEELGRRFDTAAPDAAIVVTPHHVHVEGHFAVVTAARVGEHEVDRNLASATIDALRAAGLPVVGISYGGNDATQAEHPLDWGT